MSNVLLSALIVSVAQCKLVAENMDKTGRASLFVILIAIVLVIFAIGWGQMIPDKPVDVVIFSCLVMISFVTLFTEHFFTKPTDVIASTISILLLLGPISADLVLLGKWYSILIYYNFFMLISAIIGLYLLKPDSSPDNTRNIASKILKDLAETCGNGKLLFSMVLTKDSGGRFR